jgi:adenosylcobinamide-GDP ribazoletransferase
MLAVTGAFHEDGLADTADGFGGGRTQARKLEIMRDSRIGSYGTLALILSIVVRIAAVGALPVGRAVPLLLAAGAVSRAAMLLPMSLPPARTDGLGRSLGRVPWPSRLIAVAIALTVALACLPWLLALEAMLLAGAAGAAISVYARRRIGGQTGDVLGAACVIAECGLLTLGSR